MATLSPCYPFLHPSSSSSFHKLGPLFPCTLPYLQWSISRGFRNSENDATVCVSATNKPRSRSRRTKSNEDLLSEIREFLSSVGLPHDHVPSTKELSQNGRQDLANIVRRRGYKFVKELLANATEEDTNSSEENLNGNLQILVDSKGLSAGQNDEVWDSSVNMSLSIEAAKLEHHVTDLVHGDLALSEASETDTSETDTELAPDDGIQSAQDSSIYPFLQEKVTKFIQYGVLDDNEEYDVRGAEVINGSIPSSVNDVEDRVSEMYPSRIETSSTEEARRMDLTEDLDSEVQEKVNQKEIERLKLLLHQKEVELTQLKEQIESEKLALTIFQTKAQKEINETQKLISEKDAELHATEESLSGLEEVEIQFWSDGEVVEVAGSFNGWHQRIQMEPQPTSNVSVKSQKARHWRTLLWLYPGVYEMKFIIDGHWTVDPDKETVTRGSIHNNILRVGEIKRFARRSKGFTFERTMMKSPCFILWRACTMFI